MYHKEENKNISLMDFNQSFGVELNLDHKLVKIADMIPWEKFEDDYKSLFPSHTGRSSFSFRTAFATLILSAYTQSSDRKLCQQISENPYYQYFIGFKQYTTKVPFSHTTVQNFRKRISPEMVIKTNEDICDFLNEKMGEDANIPAGTQYIIDFSSNNQNDDETSLEIVPDKFNFGTAILDATCSPSNIKYPQDYQLLNDARKATEKMIDSLHKQNNKKGIKPKTYRRLLDRDFLEISKMKKKNRSKLNSLILRLLNAIRRNIRYIEDYEKLGIYLPEKDLKKLDTIRKIHEQQRYMFDNKTHKVKDRIVSLDQPYVRPIVRGKIKTPVEFGVKYDVSIYHDGLARLEKTSFDPYNESEVLIDAIKKFRSSTGYYPKRVLVDQIYRTRKNIKFCTDHNIRISGPRLGRPAKDREISKEEKKQNKKDNVDRLEVERFFSKTKRCYGANLIRTRLQETTITTIGFSVIAANLFSLDLSSSIFLYYFYFSFEDVYEIDEIILEL